MIQNIEREIVNSLGIIILNNPPQNFIEEPEFLDINSLDKWIKKNSLKGLIIKGKGRHFSAGADTTKLYEKVIVNKTMEEDFSRGRKVLDYIESLCIPTAALIHGVCFGAGLEIALSCHIRICASNALIAFPESNMDLMPGFSGTCRLTRITGKAGALEMILSGNTLDAEKALEYGIADYVKPKKEAYNFTVEYLNKLTAGRPLHVIKAVTKSINNYFTMDRESALKEEAEMFCELVRKKYENKKI